eukprot:768603-Hanusia_phi.AAC.2
MVHSDSPGGTGTRSDPGAARPGRLAWSPIRRRMVRSPPGLHDDPGRGQRLVPRHCAAIWT